MSKYAHLILSIIIIWSVFQPSRTLASIIISEVYPAPTSDESEWVEIYNSGQNEINLLNWSLQDKLSTPSEIYRFETNQVITSQAVKVLELNSNKLNNSGDGVVLINNQSDIIDNVDFSTTQSGKSYALVNLEQHLFDWTDPTKGIFNLTPSLTPTPIVSPTPTITPTLPPTTNTPTPTTQALKFHLTEVCACPNQGESEWIEIVSDLNESQQGKVWLIDGANNQVELAVNQLTPNGYAVLTLNRNILNNSGDFLKLVNENGALIDQLNLPACKTNTSYALINQQWQTTDNITKGQTNPTPSQTLTNTPTPTPSLSTPTTAPTSIPPTPTTISTLSSKQDSILELQGFDRVAQTIKTSLPNLKLPLTPTKGSSLPDNDVKITRESPHTSLFSVIMGGILLASSGITFYVKGY